MVRLPCSVAFFLLGFSVVLPAQQSSDSLIRLLKNARNDLEKADLLLAIGNRYRVEGPPDSARFYLNQAIQMFRTQGAPYKQADALHNLGIVEHNQGFYENAIACYSEAKTLFLKSGEPFDTFFVYRNLAVCHAALDRAAEATALFDSTSRYLHPDNPDHQSWFATGLAYFLNRQGQHRAALNYRHKRYRIAQQTGDEQTQLNALYDIAYEYDALRLHDSTIYFLQIALPLALKLRDRTVEWRIKACMGISLIEKRDYVKGLQYLEEAETLGKKYGNQLCCGNTAYHGLALIKNGRPAEAKPYIAEAERLAPTLTELIDKRNVLNVLLMIYESEKNYEKALFYLRQLNTVNDSLSAKDYRKHLASMEATLKTREKETELVRRDAELRISAANINRQRLLLGIAVVITLLLALAAYQYRQISFARERAARIMAGQNQALSALDAAKSRFFANISHEFRTPLTLILAPLEPAIAAVKEHSLRGQLQAARRSALQLLKLVEELLDLSRLEAGKLTLQEHDIHVNGWLRQRLAGFESLAATKGVKLLFESRCPENLALRLDAGKLEKILNNLLSNALKFTEKGGEVRLDAYWQEQAERRGALTLKVLDNGPGIHPDDLPRIFERFYQGVHQQEGGAGIGLALSRELAQFMNGTLGVESRPGQGSVFTFSLPVAAGATTAMPAAETIAFSAAAPASGVFKPGADREKPVVLIVEDNADLRRFLEETLQPHFQVLLATDGLEALQRLERDHADLVVSDVMMPRMDGFALLEAVRRQPAVFQQIPFILLTARALDDDRLQGFQLGVDDYIAKPFEPALLIARISNLLQLRQKRHQSNLAQEMAIPDNADLAWLKKAEKAVIERIDDPDLAINTLAKTMAQSPRNLDRTLKRLSGFTPVEFIREIRLQRARQLLEQKRFSSVAEVRQAVGIENPAYFSRIFTQRFGIGPRELLGRD
ncbi:MAG: response regulator [Thermoanaerobaculia bacterium]|nr:response regulator [Thermoanaerobaculia bacterium]